MTGRLNRDAEVSALYSVFSTGSLLALRHAFQLDAEDAQLQGDATCVAFCVRRIELIDRELTSRGVLYG